MASRPIIIVNTVDLYQLHNAGKASVGSLIGLNLLYFLYFQIHI